MSCYHSDKCTKEELKVFKDEVLKWLDERFEISNLKIRAFPCYGGDVRIYTGTMEYTNRKSSFRRESAEIINKHQTIYHGTRGRHTTSIAEYFSINQDEWSDIKNSYNNPKSKGYDFNKDYIFDKLPPLKI